MIVPELSVCSYCGGGIVLDEVRAESFCARCGDVVAERLVETAPSYRTDDNGNVTYSVSLGPAMSPARSRGANLMTTFYGTRDAKGKPLSSGAVYRSYRLSKLQRAARGRGRDRSLDELDLSVRALGGRLQVHRDLVQRATAIAHGAHRSPFRGQPFSYLAAASLLLAARERGQPLSADEVAAAAGGSRKRVLRMYRMLNRALGLHIRPIRPESLVPKVASALPLPIEVQAEAMRLLRSVGTDDGGSPWVWAAGALYAAAKRLEHPLAQKAVSKAAGVSEVSVRNAMRKLGGRPPIPFSGPCQDFK